MDISFNDNTHTYKLGGYAGYEVPSVTQVLSSVGISDFGMVDDETLTRSMNYGTSVHRMTELDDTGRLDEVSLDPKLAPVLTAWRLFKETHIKRFLEVEKRVCSLKKGYAGTLDRVAESRSGEYWLIDIKTGSKCPSQRIQTAAYETAYREMTGYRKKISRMCVFLTDTFKVEAHGVSRSAHTRDMNIFLSALTVHKYKMEGK